MSVPSSVLSQMFLYNPVGQGPYQRAYGTTESVTNNALTTRQSMPYLQTMDGSVITFESQTPNINVGERSGWLLVTANCHFTTWSTTSDTYLNIFTAVDFGDSQSSDAYAGFNRWGNLEEGGAVNPMRRSTALVRYLNLTQEGGAHSNRMLYGVIQVTNATRTLVDTSGFSALLLPEGTEGVFMRATSGQTLTGSSSVLLAGGSIEYDTSSLWSAGDPHKVTIPAYEEGWYFAQATYTTANSVSSAHRGAWVRLNGSLCIGGNSSSHTGTTVPSGGGLVYLVAGDYLQPMGFSSTSSATSNTRGEHSSFGVVKVGDSTSVGAQVTATSATSAANNTWTACTFNTEDHDVGGCADLATNNDRITVPSGQGGWWLIAGGFVWAANTAGGRWARLMVNGAEVCGQAAPASTTNNPFQYMTIGLYLNEGDYIQLEGYQSSGASRNMGNSSNLMPRLSAVRLPGQD